MKQNPNKWHIRKNASKEELKECPNHRRIHDDVTLSSVQSVLENNFKKGIENPEVELLSPDQIALWRKKIKPTVLNAIFTHLINEEWDLAIKGLKFVRNNEALIPRPTEAAIHGAKDRTSEADQ